MKTVNELGYVAKPVNATDVRTGHIDFVPQNTPGRIDGRLFYDQSEDALTFALNTGGVSIQLGYESLQRVYNPHDFVLANGSVVASHGADVATGLVCAQHAVANDPSRTRVIGMCTQDIAPHTVGIVTYRGLVHEIDTSMFSVGDTLFVHPTIPGQCTTTEPEWPYFPWKVGTVVVAHPTQGVVCVAPSVDVPHSRFVCVRMSAGTQNVAATHVAVPLVWNEMTQYSAIPLIEFTPGSPDIKFLSAGVYLGIGRYQTYRTASSGFASLQFYVRQGTSLPLTRANDLPNSSVVLAIDDNTNKVPIPHTGIINITQPNTYINIMMIASYSGGTVGIEATTGLTDIVGGVNYPTPDVRAAVLILSKIR